MYQVLSAANPSKQKAVTFLYQLPLLSGTATFQLFNSQPPHFSSLRNIFVVLKRNMGEEAINDFPDTITNGHEATTDNQHNLVIDIYPLSGYYFGSKHAIPFKDETLFDRVQRMKSNYDAHGLRTRVEAVILVELFKHPHILLLQVRNSLFKLPGGRIRPGESDIDALKRKLSRRLCAKEDETDWDVGECLGMWWRPDFETLLYPYLPPNVKLPKECVKLYLVKLPVSRKFIVPKNLKLLAVPLCQVRENQKTYGQIISGVPQLLSKFSINIKLD